MEIWHRVTFGKHDAVDSTLEAMGIKYKTTDGFHDYYLIHIDMAESDPRWPKIAELIRLKNAVNMFDTLFTTEEVLAAEWCRLYPAFQRGYPQPERDMLWKQDTYEDQCPTCGVGYRQKAPFRLAGEPRMGKNDFLSLHWTWSVFCTSRVLEALTANQVTGYEAWPAIIHRKKEPSSVVSQLIFPHVAEPGLADEDKLKPETCPQCGITKYAYHKRGYMHLHREALWTSVDVQVTYEWFGSGGFSGFREILFSRRLAKLILEAGWKGLRFKPVELV